ncbi:hypothetical protein [Massilia sp. TSP1-1-2]|uniref:hypothetical protein n=1 Tax=Massilia sp. TSP1-1-2 TaxID=2804649 RepID=UPI003CEE856B
MNIIKYATLLSATGLLAACATVRTPMIFESARTSDGVQDKTLSQEEVAALMRDVSSYADMAESVYRRDFNKNPKDRMKHGCDYVSSGSDSILRLGLPVGWRRLDRALIDKLGLESGERAGAPLIPCRSGKGLDYETYVQLDDLGSPIQAAISFRGTENTKYQWADDWIANFSNVDFGLGDNPQFADARTEGSRLIIGLARVLPKVPNSATCSKIPGRAKDSQAPIDLVGHSLGGGLAQHLAFFSNACDVRKTVAFDPSPATGWFYLNRRDLVATADPDISRIYMDGEALSFVRKVSTKFNMPRNSRRDYRVVFPGVTGNAFGLHSMTLLANNIKIAVGQIADHDEMIVHYEGDAKAATVAKSN